MQEPVRILIVEDKAEDADLAKHEIRRTLSQCEFQVVETCEAFLSALEIFQPDVILSDYSLPRFDGMKALKLTLEHAPLTPLIIWTGSIREDAAVYCMKAGANNYVLKGNLKRLGPAVIRALEEKESLAARRQAEETLQKNEKRFRALIQNGLASIALLAADGTLIWESPAVTGTLHYALNEHVGRNIFRELMHPDDLEWTQDLFARVTQEPGNHEHGFFRLRHADGAWHWVEAIITNMLHEPSVNAIVANYRDVNEQKKAEEALRESQSKYQNLVETSHDLIWSVDAEGRFTFLNRAAQEIYGHEPEELIGRSFFEIMDPEHYHHDVMRFRETIARSNEIKEAESHVLHRDGRKIILSANSMVLRDEHGTVTGVVGTSRDITARKQAEETIRDLSRFPEENPNPILRVSPNGQILYANSAAQKVLAEWNISAGNLLPAEWNELIRAAYENGTERDIEISFQDQIYSILIIPIREAGYVNLYGREMTERRQAEEALRHSQNRYRALIETQTDFIVRWKPDGTRTFANEAYCRYFGLAPEQALSTSFMPLIHEEDRQRIEEKIHRLISGASSVETDVHRVIKPDGSIGWQEWVDQTIRDENGELVELQSAGRDVTERKQAEIERQALLEIMQGLANTKDLQELLGLIHHSVAKVIYARNFFVILYDESSKLFEEIYSVDQYDPPEPPSKLEKSITSYVFRSGKPLLLTRASFDELVTQGEVVLVGTNSASWLGVPLKTSGKTIGVMAVQDYENPNRYTEHDQEFLASIASQVTLTIERKRAEDALQKSEALYRQAIEVAGAVPYYESYYDEGRSIKYEFIGEGIRQITGYGPDEFNSQVWDSLVEEVTLLEDLAGYSLEEAIQRVRAGKTSIWKCEHRLRDREGKIHWVLEVAVELRDENGVSHGSIGIYQDITERKQADLELQQKNDDLGLLNEINEALVRGQNLDSIVELLAKGLSRIFSTQGNSIYSTLFMLTPDKQSIKMQKYFFSSEMARGIERLLGFSLPPIEIPIKAGGHFHAAMTSQRSAITSESNAIQDWIAEFTETKFLPPLARMAVRKLVPQIYKLLNIKSVIVVPLISEEETIGFLDVSSSVAFTANDLGRIENIAGQLTAVIQRQQANEKIRRSEEFLQSIQNALSASIAILDETGTIVQVNSAWREFGAQNGLVHPEFCLGVNYLEICDSATGLRAEEAPQVAHAIRAVIAGQESEARIEYPCHSPDENRWFTLHITKFEDGEHVWVVLAHEDITERKRAEDAMRESEEHYRAIFEGVQDAIFVESLDGKILMVNERACEMFGYSRSEFLSKTVADLVPDGHLIMTAESIASSISAEPRETANRRATGEVFPIDISGRLQVINGETVLLVVVRDISERQRAEKMLRESEERFSSAFEYASIGMAIVALDGHWLRVNWALSELVGFSEEELLQKTFQDITHPEDLESDLQHVHQLLAGEIHSYQMEKRYIHKLGHVIWVLLSVSLVQDHEGKPLYFISQIQDITERKQAEESLRAERKKAEKYLEIAGVMMLALDREGTVTLINQKGCEILGYSADEILGKNWNETFLPEAIRGEMQDVFQKLITDDIQSLAYYENAVLTKSGEERLIAWHNTMLRDEQGRIISSLSSGEDITERKRNESETRRRADEFAALYQTARDLAIQHDLPTLLNVIAERACTLLRVPGGGIYLYDQTRGDLEMVLAVGNSVPIGTRLVIGEGMAGRVAQTRQLLMVEDYHTWEGRSPQYEAMHFRAVLQVPMLYGGELIGVLSVNELRDSERKYTEVDAHLLSLFAEYAASAVQAARLLQETRRRAEETTALLEASLALSDLDLNATLQTTGNSAKTLFAADGCRIFLMESDGETLRCVLALQENIAAFSHLRIKVGEGVTGAVAASGQAEIVNEMHHDPRSVQVPGTPEEEPEAIMFAPLKERDHTIGVLSIRRAGVERPFHPADLELLKAFASMAASAVSNARLFEETQQRLSDLRASEERFRQLADNIQEAFWMSDAENGRELYLSPAAETIWGRPIQSLMYEPNAFLSTVFSEDRPAVMNAIEREINGEKVQFEYRIVRPDGSLRWIWDRAFPIFDDGGKVKKIAGISADITDRRESELALVKSQGRYQELFDSSPISIWEEDFSAVKKHIDALLQHGVMDLKEYFASHPEVINEFASLVRITDVNKASLELYHIEQKENLLKGLTEALGDGSISHFEDEILGLLGPQKQFTWEGTDHAFDGRRIEVSVVGSIPQGYEEDWSKVIVTVSDITERRKAEQQLRKLSRAVEQSGSTIVITDTAGTIEYVNPKFTETTGYSDEEVIGQNPRLLKSGFTSEEEYKQLWQTITSGHAWHGELLNRKKNGTLYWESVSISPILNDRREITHFVGVKEDITERKQSEIETRRHIAELEAVYENGLSVGRLLEPAEIGDRFIESCARYLPWHHVTIRLKKEDSDDLELVTFNLPNLKDEERGHTEQHFIDRINKVGQGLSGWVIQTGMPFRTGNVHTHPQYLDTHAGIQSGLYMPLKIGERVIGVISVESEMPDAFTEQDERLLATLANQTAIAFENARLYEAMQKELSERKRVENALRVSETHYRALADSITDVLFELDQDLHCTHWNKASETLTGIPARDAIGKSMEEIFGATQEQTRIREIYENVLKNHQPRTFETILALSGEKRSFEINAYPSTRGVSVVAKDVTDRKRTETIMQKRFELMEYSAKHSLHELMQRAVDEVSELTASTIGFFHFMDEDQNNLGTQTWSTNALRLFQVSSEDGAHLPLNRAGVWAEAVRERRPLIQNDFEALATKKGIPHGHVPIVREVVIPIIRNERIMAVMGIGNKSEEYTPQDLEIATRLADYAWDVTERKQMEIELEIERNQLAQRVEERTADLSRANSNLARALRVKDEFLANMSHELRTPLNAILGLSESLAEQIAGPLNEKQQKYISTISESGHHLLSLINDILDLAKIDAGQITLDMNKVDIHSVCQASLRMIKQLAQKKNQEVLLDIDHGLGLMWADERRLKQMIVNLLGNAVKFTPENGKLGLEVRGDQEANQISITVWDHGIGIKENDLARLFQPFVQLDSGLAREATGTGLGLALVAQMARLHGGSVNAVSESGKGSRFNIVLPWEPALAVDTASRMRVTGKFRAIQFDETNKPAILVVEDTKEVVMMLRDYLELAGYRVFTAQDGIDGIVQARHVKPDLILMDIQMPRMDGFETTRKLRSDPNFRYTPIIALTALAMPHDRERCLEAGMDEYISKPVNLKALMKIIQSCLFEQRPGIQ